MRTGWTGQPIKSVSHAQAWCIDQKRPVYIKSRKDGHLEQHSWKVVKNMPFGGLCKLMRKGRLFELHT
jgi:hypothetical protein